MIRSYRAFAALLLLLTFTVSSCRREPFGVEGSGAAVNETRYPSNFNSVDLSIDADVVLHDDPNYRIEISAQSISGSGDVYYKNNPAIDVDISGSGTLHHVQ